MLILKEQLGKSAEHWKTVRKNADLSPGLSLESGFVSFNRVGEKTKYKPIDEKNKNEQTINTQRSKTMFMFFFVFVPQVSIFPKCFLQHQHVAAKFPLFAFYLFIFSESSAESLFSSCLYVVCFLFF
jgi:hypothetical protein